VESVTQAVCDLALRFGEGGDDRSEVIMVSGGTAGQGRTALELTRRAACRFMRIHVTEPAVWCGTADCRRGRERTAAVRHALTKLWLHEHDLRVVPMWHVVTPHRYNAEPSGTFVRYDAMAIGAGSEGAQSALRAEYHSVRASPGRMPLSTPTLIWRSPASLFFRLPWLRLQSMTLEQAEKLALKVLKEVMEEKLTATNVQVASVTKERGYRLHTKEELEAAVAATATTAS